MLQALRTLPARALPALRLAAFAALAAAEESPAAAAAAADAAPPQAQVQVQVQAEIKRLTAEFAAQEAACRQRFAVTACVEESRRRRRDALTPLRAQSLAIADAERRQRGIARREVLEHKREQRVQRAPVPPEGELAATPPLLPVAPAVAAEGPAGSAAAVGAGRRKRVELAPLRRHAASDAAARRAAASDQRRQQIADDAARIHARQAERERQGKTGAPLPVPPAASAAGR